MILYVLRHGIAEDISKTGDDADRKLTAEGIKKMKENAKGMRKLDVTFDYLLTSPWKRAFETAKIVADTYDAEEKLSTEKLLAGDGDPEKLVKLLAGFEAWKTIMIVGHEPYLSRLVSRLISGGTNVALDLKKGGLAKLSAEKLSYGPCAMLDWWVPPKLLKKI